jgi:transposase
MPTIRITMRHIRETLRLHEQAGLTYGEIAGALKIAKSTVGKYVLLARTAGLDWRTAQAMGDAELQALLFRAPIPRVSQQQLPNFAAIHQELKRPGVTLTLLWEEYARDNPAAYKYTSFCVKYRTWAKTLKRSMRQVHVAGEKLFVDYAGQTVPIIDAASGEISQAQIFVATLGASNYTFACATARQTTIDWVGAQVRALEFFGGAPRLIVPDQTRALIRSPDRYDPQPNRIYEEFAHHYGCAILAARPAHPRDKPKVEGSVLLVERWILARLRNRCFFSLAELNTAIAELVTELNRRAFKKLPGCRADAFSELDAPALSPLPATRFQVPRWKTAKVNIDYHVDFDGHYYSVPHQLVGSSVEVRVIEAMVEIFHANARVACHALSTQRGRHTTTPEHMPAAHRAHLQWTPSKLIQWGRRLGVSTAEVVRWQLHTRPHPEQGYRACLGLQRMARQYGADRLEAACARALAIRSPTYASVASILKNGLDRHGGAAPTQGSTKLPEHENVRGADYYH